MAFANISDILATTIESRTKTIADNVSKNTALLTRLKQKGKQKTFSGGHKIYQELSFAENGNFGWYSGYDTLNINASDVLSAAEFEIKQCAIPIVISGLEQLQNAGKEAMIDLMESRITVAESTMTNNLTDGLYSDGTGNGGKEITGLDAAIPLANTTGTYGAINRSTWTFWQNKINNDTGIVAATVQAAWNELWAGCIRGSDRPDLIMVDSVSWAIYVASLQSQQRFTSPDVGALGFPSLKFFDADVVLDGGIGGFCPAGTAFFLNTDYIHFRPHAQRNMVPLSPDKRYALNQDAEVQILAWAGNLTCSGTQFQGRWDNN